MAFRTSLLLRVSEMREIASKHRLLNTTANADRQCVFDGVGGRKLNQEVPLFVYPQMDGDSFSVALSQTVWHHGGSQQRGRREVNLLIRQHTHVSFRMTITEYKKILIQRRQSTCCPRVSRRSTNQNECLAEHFSDPSGRRQPIRSLSRC